ncbi:peptidase M32 carboxypeptidase Taq metallopeptidase [Planoprotostelium fungivorum]|uniref:Peptidase M32 carboxypeptidase Taq metallopeptidase n=1 Tax=Planoprotostelium fungivorum TaxID=1890364 RepID=A0A2P6N2I4_9EUKA|nr:peptidase M32 carboxypeptidase Taq metallopeptidase [Planoprotostelium fungivorum]
MITRSLFRNAALQQSTYRRPLFNSLHNRKSFAFNKRNIMTVREDYDRLKVLLEDISALKGIQSLLEWDQLVMMAPKSSASRAKHNEAIVGVIHDKSVDKEVGELLNRLTPEVVGELTEWERAHVRDARREHNKKTKVPKELEQKKAKLSVEAYDAWASAKANKNFKEFAPYIQQWVDLVKEETALTDPGKDVYDALLDVYERGLDSKTVDRVFGQLKEELPPLIAAIKSKPKPNDKFMQGKTFDVTAQAAFNHQLAKDLGFDTEAGRLDVSLHPFSTSFHPTDVRMTTRYKDDQLIEGITGTIHETGHSLYEAGRPISEAYLPASAAVGMGVHESQSLLWERMVGLSEPFWKLYWPKLVKAFPQIDSSVPADDFYRLINEVRAGFIRVESDEVTYPMHIIVRYEIERDLLAGRIQVDELPKIWNEKMKQYLGIEPGNDAEGVLQDVHWSSGSFGYFPTYTLGAIYACQYFHKALEEIPDLEAKMEKGEFSVLREWLREKIHKKGSLIPSGEELARQVTGSGLDATKFIAYLKKKYTKLYDL